MNTVYIGYDPIEDTAYEVLKFTIERISGKNIRIVPLRRDILEHIGLYTRKSELIHGQPYDVIDGKPFSTQFSFSRFLVPALNLYEGKALFLDADMYIRAASSIGSGSTVLSFPTFLHAPRPTTKSIAAQLVSPLPPYPCFLEPMLSLVKHM